MESKFYDHEVLKKKRVAAGLSVEQLAKRIGCTRQWIAILEAGVHMPTAASFEKYGRGLGFKTIVDLLKED